MNEKQRTGTRGHCGREMRRRLRQGHEQGGNGNSGGDGKRNPIQGRERDGSENRNEGGSGDGNEVGNENGDRSRDDKGNGNGNENKDGGEGGGRELGIPLHQDRSREDDQALSFHVQVRDIISVDNRRRLKVASSFGRKTRWLSDNAVPRVESGPRDGKKETVTGTGTGTGMGMMTRTGTGTMTGIGTGTGTGTETRRERMGEGRERLENSEIIVDIGWKMLERE